jgi:uncharacterized membrane protein YphA (DoxX/SURF4 family)
MSDEMYDFHLESDEVTTPNLPLDEKPRPSWLGDTPGPLADPPSAVDLLGAGFEENPSFRDSLWPPTDPVPESVVAREEPVPTVAPPEVLASAYPAGMVDLSVETPSGLGELPDVQDLSSSLYRGGGDTAEPVPGIVEVDQPVTQNSSTIFMPAENPFEDQRAARARALGEVDPGADVVSAPREFEPPSTYRRWPSFVLLALRLVLAGVLGIRATQELLNLGATQELWANSILPSGDVIAIVVIILEYLAAVLLLLGLGSRIAGGLIIVVFVTILIFLVWGALSLFTTGVVGFRGELEVLMVILGLVLAGVGGGGVAVDAAIHRARLEKKNARLGLPD